MKIVCGSLYCKTKTVVNDILSDKSLKRNDVAELYGMLLRTPDQGIDWAKINKAIMERWSFNALKYIKEKAWSGKCFKEATK